MSYRTWENVRVSAFFLPPSEWCTCTCMCLCVYVVMCFVQQLCPGDVVADKLRMFFFVALLQHNPSAATKSFNSCAYVVLKKKMDEPTKNGAMSHVFSSSQKKRIKFFNLPSPSPPLPSAGFSIAHFITLAWWKEWARRCDDVWPVQSATKQAK